MIFSLNYQNNLYCACVYIFCKYICNYCSLAIIRDFVYIKQSIELQLSETLIYVYQLLCYKLLVAMVMARHELLWLCGCRRGTCACVYNDRVLIKMAAVYVYILIATAQSSLYSDHVWLHCSLVNAKKWSWLAAWGSCGTKS